MAQKKRNSISETLRTIEAALSPPLAKPISTPPKIKDVLKECSDRLFSGKKTENDDYVLKHLNFYTNFFNGGRNEKSSSLGEKMNSITEKSIFMLNQKSVVVKMKDMVDDMENLDFSKNKLEKIRKYYLENEMKIHAVLSHPSFLYLDHFLLPLHYISTCPTKDLKIFQPDPEEKLFLIKSQNNYLNTCSKEVFDVKITKNAKILPLSIYNSFLKQKNMFSFDKICRNLGKMLGRSGERGVKGFHVEREQEEEWIQDYEENVMEESFNESRNVEDDKMEKERMRMEMEQRLLNEKKKRIAKKLEQNPKVLEVLYLFIKNVYFDAEMPFKYKRKKSLNFEEFKFKNLEPKSYFALNKTLKKERNLNQLDIRKLDEARENQILSEYSLDFFDFQKYENPIQNIDINVAAYDEKPSLGTVTLAAAIYKQIKDTSKFHSRWIVLRGFNLYWYRSSDSTEAKGIIPLPSKPIVEDFVNKSAIFRLQEGVGRNLTFQLSGPGVIWRKRLANQIAFKHYYEFIDRERLKSSSKLVNYFINENINCLDMSDINFKKIANHSKDKSLTENKTELFFDVLIDSLVFHSRLKEINLTKCWVGGSVLVKFLDGLSDSKIKLKLQILRLEKNNMNFQSVLSLSRFLVSENSLELKEVDLSHNDLYDQGAIHLAETLYNRHNFLIEHHIQNYLLPLETLNLANIKMTDQGFFALVSSFDKIHKINKSNGLLEYTSFLSLNISENLMTDNSLKSFIHLLDDFSPFSSLDLSKCKKIKSYIVKSLVNVLKKQGSLVYLNYAENEVELEGFLNLFECLEENYVIRGVKVTIPYGIYEKVLEGMGELHQFFEITEF